MVRQIVTHADPLHPEADRPLRHFELSANAALRVLEYLTEHIDPSTVYAAVYNRHLSQLRRLILAECIESFERFLKELAAACIDYLAPYITDDRFDDFLPRRGGTVAAFVNASSIGRALCESDTWLSNASINSRFASLLKDLGGADWEHLFPQANQQPAAERPRAATLAILWQIRHNLAHNVGVITHSDAMRFRALVGGAVEPERRLSPADDDLRYAKRFLSEAATRTNERVGRRLAQLLGELHAGDAGLFDAQARADEVSRRFTFPVTINGHVGLV